MTLTSHYSLSSHILCGSEIKQLFGAVLVPSFIRSQSNAIRKCTLKKACQALEDSLHTWFIQVASQIVKALTSTGPLHKVALNVSYEWHVGWTALE